MDDFGLASNTWSPSTLERAAAKNSTNPVIINSNTRHSSSAADAVPSSHTESEPKSQKAESAERTACQLLPGQQFSLSICLDSSDGPYRR